MFVRIVFAMLMLGVAFGVLERWWPSIRGQRLWRRPGMWADASYFFIAPTVGKALSGLAILASVMTLGALTMMPDLAPELRAGVVRDTWVSRQPVAVQLLALLFLGDFIGYWSHRAFHHLGPLWRLHAVHHSSRQVDWLASARVHPLNDVLSNVIVALPLVALGFTGTVIASFAPILTLYALMLHANLSWTFGPLRHVITSPVFHRWHHTTEEQALNTNFAGLFSVIDRVFGTYYMPAGVQPTEFGIVGESVPDNLWGQLRFPFVRRKRERAVIEG